LGGTGHATWPYSSGAGTFDLLLEWGADLKTADVYTVLNTYNVELYERFRAAGYDLTERHEMGSILGHGTRNRPLFGFMK
jgi:hypothetical protein